MPMVGVAEFAVRRRCRCGPRTCSSWCAGVWARRVGRLFPVVTRSWCAGSVDPFHQLEPLSQALRRYHADQALVGDGQSLRQRLEDYLLWETQLHAQRCLPSVVLLKACLPSKFHGEVLGEGRLVGFRVEIQEGLPHLEVGLSGQPEFPEELQGLARQVARQPEQLFGGGHEGFVHLPVVGLEELAGDFNEGRINVHDEQRSGRPSLPESTVARIDEMVRANRRITLEEIEDGLNEDCNHFSVHKIVSETLGYRKVSARWVDKWLKEAAGEWYNTGITKLVDRMKKVIEHQGDYWNHHRTTTRISYKYKTTVLHTTHNKIFKEENKYFSIALDESTDNTVSAQVLFFIRAITMDFRCFEELLALGTLSGRTRGVDILENFKIKICEAGLNINNSISVCTDGAPAMVGKREGFISLLKKEYANLENLISFHCILHQQNLCAKSASLNDTSEKIIGIVNFIRSNSIRHRQFRDIIMSDNDTFNGDLPYHCKIRWLSRGQVLLKIFTLRQQIIKFFEKQNKYCDLSDKEFCRDAAFLCDMTMKQNELNLNLQGKTKYIYVTISLRNFLLFDLNGEDWLKRSRLSGSLSIQLGIIRTRDGV
ncbi:GTF2IRD2B [Cordylochernes scorpioides]|uniref:GTF2IRD2B n=1 Tax=Cordylochernes scorpioides TaxID=51811 RepID=A0ABY6KFG4_9ARAC|nr:GTF2IRD2B [Cordylochernes scorpioides]